jgi:hypothetical protein
MKSNTPAGIRKPTGFAALRQLVKNKRSSATTKVEKHSIEQFMQMLTAEETPVEVTVPPKDKVMETYHIEDRDHWQRWRAGKEVPTASMLGSYYGFGYNSFNAEFKQLTRKKTPEEPKAIAKKMMDHGNNFEPSARAKFYSLISGTMIRYESEGNTSYIVELFRNNVKGSVMVTPDCMFFNKEGKRVIAEYKCPANGIVIRKKPLKTVADEHMTCYPTGRHGHVLQAATYALAFGCEEYYLFYYFTDGTEYYWANLKYRLSEDMKDMVFDAIVACEHHIKVYKDSGSIGYPKIKKLDTLQGYRNKMEIIMNASLLSCDRGDITQELQKEAPDQSEQ